MAAMGSGAWLPVCMVEPWSLDELQKKKGGLHKRINNLGKIFAKEKSVWIGNLNPT